MSCEDERRELLRAEVERFFVLGLEYARVKCLGVQIKDGALHHVAPSERVATETYMLEQLAAAAVRNLALMTTYPGEHEAMTPMERHEWREKQMRSGGGGE